MHITVKTLLGHVQDFGPCRIVSTDLRPPAKPDAPATIAVRLDAVRRRKARCSCCRKPAPRYDQLAERRWHYLPLLSFLVVFFYRPWRVQCAQCGVRVEHLPWSAGKSPYAVPYMHFLARWARRLSWQETARVFCTSWDAVRRSVEWLVVWGLLHRDLLGVIALGVDELHWAKGKKAGSFVTVIHQIDAGRRRLLWVGRTRTAATLKKGLRALEAECPGFLAGVRYLCSDMWKPYLQVARTLMGHATNILDRFHIEKHLHGAVDEVRRGEQARMSKAARARVKGARFVLLKRRGKVRGKARAKLRDALCALGQTARAWVHKEAFAKLWRYRSVAWARAFLANWIASARRTGIAPLVRVAKMLETHGELLLNYFRARRQYSNGITEGLNRKTRASLAKAYGHRSFDVLQLAMYHSLADLPEPKFTHRFC